MSRGAKRSRQRAWAALCLGMVVSNAQAAPQSPVSVTRLHLDYQVQADAGYTLVSEIVQQLHTEAAVRGASQMQLPYSASLDEFKLLEAYTLKKDGRRVAVPPSSIYVQDGLISAQGATSYQDIKTTVVVYPDVAAGDSIMVKTRLVRRKAVLPGTFTLARAFDSGVPYNDVLISVTAPKTLPLTIENVEVPLQSTNDLGASIRRVWSYRSSTTDEPEDDAVDPLMYRPRLLVSSLSSYRQLAAAASVGFEKKAVITAPIQRLANEIVAGSTSRQQEAKKLYEWITRNVRYFLIVLDVGGYVPRTADAVLASRYGDCKDHAVLLQALLAARGFTSYLALVNSSPLYELPKVPVLAAFDHVINYIPELNTFFDSNGGAASYGVLPFQDVDKPVVLLGSADVEGLRTPNLKPATNTTTVNTQIIVRPDGRASGQDALLAHGASGLAYSAWGDTLGGQDPVRVARDFILRSQLIGEGTVTLEPFNPESGFSFMLLYELRNFVDMSRPGSLRVTPPLDQFGGNARAIVSDASVRRAPYQCTGRAERANITVTFPPGTRITLPRDVSAISATRQYRSRYQMQAVNVVRIEREFIASQPHAYCQPDDHPASVATQEKILEDLRSEIRYAAPGIN